MWEGGSYRTSNPRPKNGCSIGEFCVLIFQNSQKPDNISAGRWNAMMKWKEKREQEGFSLREILALEDGFYE